MIAKRFTIRRPPGSPKDAGGVCGVPDPAPCLFRAYPPPYPPPTGHRDHRPPLDALVTAPDSLGFKIGRFASTKRPNPENKIPKMLPGGLQDGLRSLKIERFASTKRPLLKNTAFNAPASAMLFLRRLPQKWAFRLDETPKSAT